LAELLDLLGFTHVHTAILRLPRVDGVLRHALLPWHVLGRSTRFHLLQRRDNLRLAVLALAHPVSPFVRPKIVLHSGRIAGVTSAYELISAKQFCLYTLWWSGWTKVLRGMTLESRAYLVQSWHTWHTLRRSAAQ